MMEQQCCSTDDDNNSARIERLLEAEAAVLKERDHVALANACGGGVSSCCTPTMAWREKVVQWCYDVTDHLNENRSVVYIAINIMDRYCAILSQSHNHDTQQSCVLMDEKTYELASMTAVFLAVRIAGSGNLRLAELTSMSRGGIQVQDVIHMGTNMIKALTWEHRIVIPLDFVSLYLESLSPSTPTCQLRSIFESATYLVEISVCDIFLSRCKPSEVALAAIMDALEEESPTYHLPCALLQKFVTRSQEIAKIRNRLQLLYRQSADNKSGSKIQNARPHLISEDEGDCEEERRQSVVRSVSDDDLPITLRLHSSPASKRKRGCNFQQEQNVAKMRVRN